MAATQGYRTQSKKGQSQFQTFQQVGRAGGGSYAADTVSKVLWDTTPLNDQAEAGSTKNTIIATAHGALPGDMIRFVASSANPGIEVGVISVDTNTIELAGELPAPPVALDEFKIMRWITPTADQNGNLVFTPGPTTYNQNGVITTVAEDTANPANNRGLPVLPTYYKDGVPVTVNIDTVDPSQNRPLPVELANVSGSVTINAGDLNVSTDATNDSMAIGDGVTGDLAKVDLNDDATTYALKVKDDDANAKLANIILDTLALSSTTGQQGAAIANDGISVHGSDGTNNRKLLTDATGKLQIDVLSTALPTGASTLAEQQTQTTRLTSIRDAVELLDNSVNQDGNPAGSAGLLIGGKDAADDFQHVRVNTNGELIVALASGGLATETTLSSINAKIANDFGASPGAVRVAAQLGNPSGGADFGANADTAQTLRVSANLKRNGNELSYNNNAPDANTLRVSAQIAVNGLTPDIGTGAGGPNTLRTVAILHDNDGDPIAFENVQAASPTVYAFNTQSVPTTAVLLGWTGSQHREVLVDAQGKIEASVTPATSNAFFDEVLAISDAGATTISPPAGAKRFKIQADDTNNANVRMRLDGTATSTSGLQLQPGRSEDFEMIGVISLRAEAGGSACKVNVHWGAN